MRPETAPATPSGALVEVKYNANTRRRYSESPRRFVAHDVTLGPGCLTTACDIHSRSSDRMCPPTCLRDRRSSTCRNTLSTRPRPCFLCMTRLLDAVCPWPCLSPALGAPAVVLASRTRADRCQSCKTPRKPPIRGPRAGRHNRAQPKASCCFSWVAPSAAGIDCNDLRLAADTRAGIAVPEVAAFRLVVLVGRTRQGML